MANKRWVSNAASVVDLWTISAPTGTIVSQTYSVTINGKSVQYVAGGADTASMILAGLQTALSSVSTPPPPEFQELTWTALPAGGPYTSLTGTQTKTGVPTVITTSTSGAATGFAPTNTTPASGPNFFNVAANWDTNSAPANGDVLYFDGGNVDCLYGLNTSLTTVTIVVNAGFSGKIGLPYINTGNANNSNTLGNPIGYTEYRTTNLTLAGGTAILNCPSLQRCNLAFGANTTTVRVVSTSTQRLLSTVPIVLITGGNVSSELDVTQGDVGLAFYENQTANFPTIKTGYVANANADVNLYCGVGCTLGTITKNGGVAELHANVTIITQNISGGTLILADSVTATTINAYGGNVNLNTIGTVGTINLYGSSILSANGDPRSHTITNPINVLSGNVSIIDSQKSINSGTLTISMNGLPSLKLIDHGGNTTWTLA